MSNKSTENKILLYQRYIAIERFIIILHLPQGVTLHGLRKSCASVLVHDNKDIKSIQQWLGHKDEETTIKIYAKVKEKEAKNDISEHLSDIIPIKDYGDDN